MGGKDAAFTATDGGMLTLDPCGLGVSESDSWYSQEQAVATRSIETNGSERVTDTSGDGEEEEEYINKAERGSALSEGLP